MTVLIYHLTPKQLENILLAAIYRYKVHENLDEHYENARRLAVAETFHALSKTETIDPIVLAADAAAESYQSKL